MFWKSIKLELLYLQIFCSSKTVDFTLIFQKKSAAQVLYTPIFPGLPPPPFFLMLATALGTRAYRHGYSSLCPHGLVLCNIGRLIATVDICLYVFLDCILVGLAKNTIQKYSPVSCLDSIQKYYFLDTTGKIGDFFLSSWAKKLSYRKSTTNWKKLKVSAFSTWLYIFCSTFGSPVAIKRKLPKLKEDQNQRFLVIQGYIKGKAFHTKGKGNICPKWRNAPFCQNFKSFLYCLLSK